MLKYIRTLASCCGDLNTTMFNYINLQSQTALCACISKLTLTSMLAACFFFNIRFIRDEDGHKLAEKCCYTCPNIIVDVILLM